MSLAGKVILITGATSGIGRETAILAAEAGASVAMLGRDENELDKLSTELSENNRSVFTITCDVTDKSRTRDAVEKTIQHFGKLDVLVNSAGIIASGTIENTTTAAWDEMMAINVTAVFHLMQFAVPHLEKTQGNIVNVSSVVGTRSFPGILAYSVSKTAVDQLTRCSAMELAPKKIRVNAVNPGVVITNLHRRSGMDEERYAAFLKHSETTHPIGRVGDPRDIANGILYLADDSAGWVTGVTLNIDGGRHLTCAR